VPFPVIIYVKSISSKHIIGRKWEQMCFGEQCEDSNVAFTGRSFWEKNKYASDSDMMED